MERDVMHAVRLALGKDPRVVLWRNQTGMVKHDGRTVRYGLAVGGADLIGILRPSGRFIAIECKAPGGKTSIEQDRFLALIRNAGGFACVVSSMEQAKAAVERAVKGACE